MMRRTQSIFFTLLLLCSTLPLSAQGTAEVWINKAVSLYSASTKRATTSVVSYSWRATTTISTPKR